VALVLRGAGSFSADRFFDSALRASERYTGNRAVTGRERK